LYAERAPITDALFVDPQGLSSASAVAMQKPWPAPDAEWRALAATICDQISQTRQTWWEQPRSRACTREELRAALHIPPHAMVVLFAGQVDEDTQSFLFSPAHSTNLDAFEWLLAHMADVPNVYVLGKQHPKSRTPAERYADRLARSGVAGAWRDDLSVDDALAVADRVAAVNSTMLYEALANERPVLAMGEWLLSDRGAAYETLREPHAVADWLRADEFPGRLARFHDALGYLLSQSVYAYATKGNRAGMLDAEKLADRLAAAASAPWQAPEAITGALLKRPGTQPASWSPADPAWTDRRDRLFARLNEWHYGQSLRHALLPAYDAARHGRRVRVWGSGAARRAIARLLHAAGASVDSRVVLAQNIQTVPVPDFIIVATAAHDSTTHHLTSLGLQGGVDFSVVEPHLLHALSVPDRMAGDAA
jgi:hypothetical protein